MSSQKQKRIPIQEELEHRILHGPKFLRACNLLRANPKASGNYRPLHERISHELPGPEDKIMLRVKKLMALAESQNQHEAELAMAKAHEFIAKYNIDLLAHNEDRNFISVLLASPLCVISVKIITLHAYYRIFILCMDCRIGQKLEL